MTGCAALGVWRLGGGTVEELPAGQSGGRVLQRNK